jgi:hypothetical protein
MPLATPCQWWSLHVIANKPTRTAHWIYIMLGRDHNSWGVVNVSYFINWRYFYHEDDRVVVTCPSSIQLIQIYNVHICRVAIFASPPMCGLPYKEDHTLANVANIDEFSWLLLPTDNTPLWQPISQVSQSIDRVSCYGKSRSRQLTKGAVGGNNGMKLAISMMWLIRWQSVSGSAIGKDLWLPLVLCL